MRNLFFPWLHESWSHGCPGVQLGPGVKSPLPSSSVLLNTAYSMAQCSGTVLEKRCFSTRSWIMFCLLGFFVPSQHTQVLHSSAL